MNSKDELLESAGETFEYANQYVQKQLQLIKLETAKQSAKSISILLTSTIIAILIGTVLLMFTLALGFWLGSLWESNGLAFFAIGVIYAIVSLAIYLFRSILITNPILRLILKSFLG